MATGHVPVGVTAALVGVCVAGAAALALPWQSARLFDAEIVLSGWGSRSGQLVGVVFGAAAIALLLSRLAGTWSRLVTGLTSLVFGLTVIGLSVSRGLSAGTAAFRGSGLDIPLPESVAIGPWVVGGLGAVLAAGGIWQVSLSRRWGRPSGSVRRAGRGA